MLCPSGLLLQINLCQTNCTLFLVCCIPAVLRLVCSGKAGTHVQLSHLLKGLVTSRCDTAAQLLTCRQLTPDSRILPLFSACHPSTRYLTSLSLLVIVKDPFTIWNGCALNTRLHSQNRCFKSAEWEKLRLARSVTIVFLRLNSQWKK